MLDVAVGDDIKVLEKGFVAQWIDVVYANVASRGSQATPTLNERSLAASFCNYKCDRPEGYRNPNNRHVTPERHMPC